MGLSWFGGLGKAPHRHRLEAMQNFSYLPVNGEGDRARLRARWWGTCLLFLLAVIFMAPAQAAIPNQLTVGVQLEPPNLDPTSGAAAAVDEVVSGSLFETLVTLDRAGQLKPLLALDWQQSADGLSYEFRLRSHVRFHDGTAFDATAVRFSLLRAIATNSTNVQRDALSVIRDVEILAPDRVRLRLKHKDADLLYTLALGDAAMVSPVHADHLANRPIGTGPYQFASRKQGDSVTLKRFDGYWGGPAHIGQVTFKFISDPTAALSALQAGDVQLFTDFPAPESMETLRHDKRFNVIIGPTEGEVILAMNNRTGPLADRRVRQALAFAIDRRAIINGAMYGYGQPIGSHFPPQNAAYTDLTGLYAYDPAKASQLLIQAGYAQGFDLDIILPPPVYARRSGEIIAAQLAQVGVRVHIRNVEWAQWLDQVYGRHAFDLTVIDHAEPLDYAIYGNKDYYFGFDSPQVQGLLHDLSQTDAPREREQILRAIQTAIAQEAPNAFLFQFPRLYVADAGIHDIWLNSPVQALDWHAGSIAGAQDQGEQAKVDNKVFGWMATGFAVIAVLAALIVVGRQLGWTYLARRAGILLVTLAGASFVVFAVVQVLPGDPAAYMMGLNTSPQALDALRDELGLNAPFLTRYLHWIAGLLHGDLGVSYVYKAPVADLIGQRLVLSLPLAALAVLFSLVVGLPLGILSALRRGKASDYIVQGVSEIGIATPNYVVSVLLVFVVATVLRLVPAGGFPGWEAGLGKGLAALALPAIALGLPQAAVIAKILRTALIDALSAPWITTARARGLPSSHIVLRHALPNAFQPILTTLGLQLPYLLAGSAIIESVFSLPGLGRLAFQAVSQRDLIVVQAVVIVMVALVVISGFIVDILSVWLDPRLRGARS